MKIAAWMEGFPSLSETYVLWHLAELCRHGHDVTLYPATPGRTDRVHPEVQELALLERVRCPPKLPGGHRAAPARARELLLALRRHPVLAGRVLRAAAAGARTRGWSQAIRHLAHLPAPACYDVLHAYFGPPGRRAELLRRAGAVRGPLVTSFLGFDLNVLGRRLGARYYRDLFERAERLCVSSKFMRGRLLELGARPDRVTLLPLGMPVDDFPFRERRPPASGPVRLVTAARLTEVKGIEVGLRALALLRARQPSVPLHWDLLGDGPLAVPLRRLATELGLQSVTTFHGARPMDEVRRVLAEAHLCLFPGVRAADGAEEALGGAVIEAQAVGLPVLTTDAGGIAEGMVPGESGLVVPWGDPEALADGLATLVARADEWPAMGRRGRAHVQDHYDSRRLHGRWIDLYRSLAPASR